MRIKDTRLGTRLGTGNQRFNVAYNIIFVSQLICYNIVVLKVFNTFKTTIALFIKQ